MLLIKNNKLIVNGKVLIHKKKLEVNPNALIMYTSNNNGIVQPNKNDFGEANIISNTYENGVGIIVFDTDITTIGNNAFYECSSLTSITIPNSATFIGDWSFYGCTGITSITIPNSVTSIGNRAFDECTSLESITVDENNTMYDSRDNCNALIQTSSNTLITGCKNTVIHNTITSIADYAFCNCRLTSIEIPNSVKSIGTYAFYQCYNLTSLSMGNSVTSIGNYAFYNCLHLTSITIPYSLSKIGDYVFYCCGFTSVEIPYSISSIGKSAFLYSKLTSIEIPGSVSSINDNAFNACSNLKSVIMNRSTPPTLGGFNVFKYTNSSLQIYVPDASVDNYKSATKWSSYASKIKPISEKPA